MERILLQHSCHQCSVVSFLKATFTFVKDDDMLASTISLEAVLASLSLRCRDNISQIDCCERFCQTPSETTTTPRIPSRIR